MIVKLLRWGNSYGIRVSKADVEREGLREGQEFRILIRAKPGQKVDVSRLPAFDLGGDLSERHDEVEWA